MKKCKVKYRVRYFSSKGAFLILVWTLLLTTVCYSLPSTIGKILSVLQLYLSFWWIGLGLLVVVIATLFSGMLADIKLGKYKVTKAGFILLFISTIINCLTDIFVILFPISNNNFAVMLASYSLVALLAVIGIITSIVSILQLGLQQMPDASTSNITSFISWFTFSVFCGIWISDTLQQVEEHCLDNSMIVDFTLILSFLEAFCMSFILIFDYLTAKQWLLMEPSSSRALKMIYKVLKFAAKHKVPLNRSAFTYWEENIPSRIDLGKSKYGGPFTNEQVEDVKTILRLLLVSLSLLFVSFAIKLDPPLTRIPSTIINSCGDFILMKFIYDKNCWILLATLIHEVIIYPLFSDKLPSILTKIGIATMMNVVISLLCLLLDIVNRYLLESHMIAIDWTIAVVYSVVIGISVQLLTTSIIELICAQSPYNIRGVFTGYMTLIIGVSLLAGKAVEGVWHSLFVALAVKTFICLLAFIFHCVVAHWYKGRLRDDVYASHRVIEEVYDRYLSYSD